jgi:hypothetical protein
MASAVDQLETTHVRLDGAVLPCGAAARRVMRAKGWINVGLEASDGEYRITDAHGGGEVRLPIVPPHCKTASALTNDAKMRWKARGKERG